MYANQTTPIVWGQLPQSGQQQQQQAAPFGQQLPQHPSMMSVSGGHYQHNFAPKGAENASCDPSLQKLLSDLREVTESPTADKSRATQDEEVLGFGRHLSLSTQGMSAGGRTRTSSHMTAGSGGLDLGGTISEAMLLSTITLGDGYDSDEELEDAKKASIRSQNPTPVPLPASPAPAPALTVSHSTPPPPPYPSARAVGSAVTPPTQTLVPPSSAPAPVLLAPPTCIAVNAPTQTTAATAPAPSLGHQAAPSYEQVMQTIAQLRSEPTDRQVWQQVLKIAPARQLTRQMVEVISANDSLMTDLCLKERGNIMCHLMEVLRGDSCNGFVQFIANNFMLIATNQSGCIALPRVMAAANAAQRAVLFQLTLTNLLELSVHQYGNYVVKHVVVFPDNDVSKQICVLLTQPGALRRTCGNKFGSHVVEDFIKHAPPHITDSLVVAMFSDASQLRFLTHDKFGNYAVQATLQFAASDQADQRLKPWCAQQVMPVVQGSQYQPNIMKSLFGVPKNGSQNRDASGAAGQGAQRARPQSGPQQHMRPDQQQHFQMHPQQQHPQQTHMVPVHGQPQFVFQAVGGPPHMVQLPMQGQPNLHQAMMPVQVPSPQQQQQQQQSGQTNARGGPRMAPIGL